MKLYDGCYGVLNNGEVVGPVYDTQNGSDWLFECGAKSWKKDGAFIFLKENPNSFRSVHPTRKEAEAAVMGETVKRPILQGFSDWRAWTAGIVIGLILAYFLFSCTSPTEPVKPSCKNEVWSDSAKAWVWNTTVCLNKNAYGREGE